MKKLVLWVMMSSLLFCFPPIDANAEKNSLEMKLFQPCGTSQSKLSRSFEDFLYFRRVLGQKKDNFFIGRKSSSSREVLELLNSVGVLTSNPYHIVRQGEINSLAEATPAARLKLPERRSTRYCDEFFN